MKKFLFLAALASVALAGCVSDESPTIDATPGDKLIAFNSPVLYGNTRAVSGEMTNPYSQTESFNVYAVWSPNDFAGWEATGAQWYMGNTGTGKEGIQVTYDSTIDDGTTTGSGAWAPATAYYWPKNGKLTFAAYSPSDAIADFSYSKEGLTIENFEIPGTAATQYDLMFSKRTYNKTTSTDGTNTTYDGVDIQFQHALSSIRFMVKLKDDYTGTTIKVKKISVYNVQYKGKFEEQVNEAGTPGTYSSDPKWTPEASLVAEASAYVPFTGDQTVTTTATLLSGATNLILMPQVFHDDTTEQNDQVNVKVEYTIQSASSSEIAQTHEQKLSAIKTEAGNISSWKIGKRYTYTIVFGLDKIYFAPSVEDWENVTPNPGDINI